MYTLDFETIKQVMQAHQKTGFLRAEVSAGVANLREPCRIEITIMAGIITTCTIVGISGRHLAAEKAMQEILRLGQLSWSFTPQQEVDTLLTVPTSASEEHFLPRRNAHLQPWQMSSLSRLQRMVFALSDGTKSTAKIAAILSISPDAVEKSLYDLQSKGFITREKQDDRT